MKISALFKPSSALVVAVLAAAAAAMAGSSTRQGAPSAVATPSPEPTNEVPPPPDWAPFVSDAPLGAEDQDEPAPPQTAVAGTVLEQIDVGKYSYLRLGVTAGGEAWAAVPKTASRLHTQVTVQNAELMTSFTSATLKRTFEQIYFGSLDEADGAEAYPAHGANPGSTEETSAPHPGAGKAADSVAVGKIARAPGPLGHTVGELGERRAALAGKRARVRGVVVKSTPGVLGRTFLHLRDGSGSAGDGSNDLAVTSSATPAVGEEVTLEGTVATDQDFGAGYRYSVLLADATLVGE